jgi:hypothetical protein
MNTTRIIEKLTPEIFREMVIKRKIEISPHAIDHLSNSQRKLYDQSQLILPLTKEIPALFGLQRNGNYSVYFKRKEYYLKIVLTIKKSKIEIITYLNTNTLPVVRENEE